MGKLSDRIRQLVARQVKARGLVVWYDPDREYAKLAPVLNLTGVEVLTFVDSFFRLRHVLEPHLEWVSSEGRAKDDCSVPPKVVLYVPKSRAESDHALVEAETAGIVIEPGAESADRNTRLRIQAEAFFQEVAPEKAAQLARQVEEGLISLEDLDRIAEEVGNLASGALKLIFGAASPLEVLIAFASNDGNDAAITEKKAAGELRALVAAELGFDIGDQPTLDASRDELRRLLLLGEFLLGLPEADRPASMRTVPVPESATQQDALRHLCETWRNRLDVCDAYAEAARDWEKRAGIANLPPALLLATQAETFSAIETRLLWSTESRLLAGESEPVAILAAEHRAAFWSRTQPALALRWSALELAARFQSTAQTAHAELKKPPQTLDTLVRAYALHAAPWMMADRLYRHWEVRLQAVEPDVCGGEETFEKLNASVRQKYDEWVDASGQAFVKAYQAAGFEPGQTPPQATIWSRQLEPARKAGKRCAYLLVDALRYEMASELLDGIRDEFTIGFEPALATAPSITPIGMAALMPGAEKGIDLVAAGGVVAASINGVTLKSRADRVALLEKEIPDGLLVLKLGDLLRITAKRRKEIAQARLIVVTSQEIDRLGEDDDQGETRRWMDEMLEQLRRGVRALARAGIEHIVITADHGHIFADHFDPGMVMDAPGGQTMELHSRAWIGRGGVSADGFVRVTATQLGLGGDLEFAFPRGHGCFKVRGGAGGYFHGGLSLQELVIPVATLIPKADKQSGGAGGKVLVEFARPTITNRFFSASLRLEKEGLFGVDAARVRVAVEADGKEVGFCAMASSGYEEGTREVLLQSGQPNALTFMLSTTEPVSAITLRVIDCQTQLELAQKPNVPVKLSL